MIDVAGISKSFQGNLILQNLHFQIQTGDCLFIVGKSGCGKSVTLKILTGLLQPDSGKLWINGQEVSLLPVSAWQTFHQQMGVVFQNAALFDSLSVYENIAIRLLEEKILSEDTIQKKVLETLEKVGLFDSVLTQKPMALSGGMRKRVGIARAIIHQPKWLFYDEPTTGLDPVTAETIDLLIQQLAIQTTTIVISHDLISARQLASHILFLDQGKVQYFGKADAFFLSEDPLIRRFLRRG